MGLLVEAVPVRIVVHMLMLAEALQADRLAGPSVMRTHPTANSRGALCEHRPRTSGHREGMIFDMLPTGLSPALAAVLVLAGIISAFSATPRS